MNTKKIYEQPEIHVLNIGVEKGFAVSFIGGSETSSNNFGVAVEEDGWNDLSNWN